MIRRSLAAAALVLCASDARAAAGTAFAETSRSAALADAVTARPGDAGTLYTNPAGLSDLKEPEVAFGVGGDYVSQYFQTLGDPKSSDRSRA